MPIDHAIDQLSSGLRGELIGPRDAGYEDARSLYNGMIDKRPRLIARAVDVADVIAAVRFARDEGLDLAIRGGGHNGPGLGSVDDGLVIDMAAMTGVRVDPDARTARVGPGCRWGDVDHATHAFGLATVSGIIANTGVPGLALGGGHGYLSRKHGLTIDNLLSADVVLADGRLVHASETEHPDLFWALRGGGGNFGVVTSLELRLHPVDRVIGGPLFWPIEALEPTLRFYREWLPRLPEDIYAFYMTGAIPPAPGFPEALHGRPACGLMWCCLGPAEEAKRAIDDAHGAAEPLFEEIGPVPYPVLQGMFDELYPSGLQWYWKGDFVRDLSDEAIAEHVRFAEVPTGHSLMHLYPIDGAVQRVASNATAWGHRDATWSMVIAGVDPDPSNAPRITSWARDYWQAVHPYTVGAAYVNFMMEEGADRVAAAYGDNHRRLRDVKAAYDPGNVFHVNQNIEPAS